MKKILTFILTLALAFSLGGLAGCGANKADTLDIVCTIFPQYDWTKTLVSGNDRVELTIMQDSGVDLHNYQPTAADKVKILNCDLLLYVGGESDKWVEEMLSDPAKNPDMKVVKLIEEVKALDEEEVPGGEDHDHEDEEDHDHEDEQEGDKDEHVWLSLNNAQTLVRAIAKNLKSIDPEHGELYDRNLSEYLTALEALEEQYEEATRDPARRILLFGDRFPFRYLVEDYDLAYYAAFSGCSAETEASFEVIKSLAEAVNANHLPYILVLEGSDQGIANQIKNSTSTKDQEILVLNSIQSVTKKQIESGTTYLSLMTENLGVLKKALN